MKATPPPGAEDIEKCLASGQMRGIDPAMAKRIVALFGDATFEIIEADRPELRKLPNLYNVPLCQWQDLEAICSRHRIAYDPPIKPPCMR